jgi:MFS family permease
VIDADRVDQLHDLILGASVVLLLNLLARFMVRDPETLSLSPDGEAATPAAIEPGGSATPAVRSPREALRMGQFWLLSGVVLLSLLTIPSAFVHLPQHALDLGLQVPRSTFIAIVGLFALLGNLVLGWISDFLGRRGGLLCSLVIGTVAYAGFTAAETPAVLYVASACFGFHYGTFASLFPAVVGDFFGRLHAGTLTGFSFALGSAASAVGPIATGLVADRTGHYFSAFLCGTLINAMAVVLCALARPPRSPW